MSFAQQRNTMRTALQPLLSLIALFKLSRLSYNGVATMTPVMLWVRVVLGDGSLTEGWVLQSFAKGSGVELIVNVVDNDDLSGSWINRHGRGRKQFVCQDSMTSIFWGEDDWLRINCSIVDDDE